MQARQERMLRAVLSAGVGTVATACAHDAGGGHVPPPLLLATVFLLGVLLSFGLTGRRVTLLGLLPAVTSTQVLLHVVFTAAEGSAATTLHARHAAHHVDALRVADLVVAEAHGGGMLWAHALAGLVTLFSLHAGTRSLRRALRSVAVRVVAVLGLVLGVDASAVRVGLPRGVVAAPAELVSLITAATRSLRGPPTASLPH